MRTLAVLSVLMWTACGGGGEDPTGTTTGGTTGATTGTATGNTTGTGTGTGTCTTWVATYDLTGSRFHIDALLDFTILLEEPYSDDLNMGPGELTVRFVDDGGAPGEGAVTVGDYALTQNFTTGSPALASVNTDLVNTASDPCGVASGTLAGDTASWSPAQLDPHCQNGEISCEGIFCGESGSPPEDAPFVFDDVCGTLPITDFVFSADRTSFTMAQVEVSSDANQSTFMDFVGTQVDLQMDADTPACLCP